MEGLGGENSEFDFMMVLRGVGVCRLSRGASDRLGAISGDTLGGRLALGQGDLKHPAPAGAIGRQFRRAIHMVSVRASRQDASDMGGQYSKQGSDGFPAGPWPLERFAVEPRASEGFR